VLDTTEPVLAATEPVLNATEPVLDATAPIIAATEPVLNSTQPVLAATEPVLNTTEPVLNTTQPVLEATAPIIAATEPVLNTTEPMLNTTEPVLNATEPVLNATEPVLDATAPIITATEPVLNTTQPVLAATEPVLNTTQPVLETATPRTTESMVTPTLDPIASEAITPVVQRPVLENAAQSAYSFNPQPALAIPVDIERDASQGGVAYSGSPAETQSAKSAELLLGSSPRLFDSSLLSGALATIASYTAAVIGNPDGMPHPLFPSELPSGAPPVGSTYRGGSGIGIGLELSAILALLLTLSRIGGSSVSPREGFKLVSSPRLVTERPG
jgi:hypothetical protein